MGIYNCEDTLKDAIESILNQTYTNWELVMCDDCSTDSTNKIANEYVNKYPHKILLVKNDKNMKLSFSLNHCLKYVSGEYIARMDSDDISIPTRFEKQVNYLQNNPEINLVGSFMQYFDGNELGAIVSKVEHPNKNTLKHAVPFNHATIMTYKWVYDSLGGYTVSERTNRAQDLDLWFRFYAKNYCGYNLQEVLYLVRENLDAIKRRTFSVRWNAIKTRKMGYKLLGYPRLWILKDIFMLIKSLIPNRIILLFRKTQAKNKR